MEEYDGLNDEGLPGPGTLIGEFRIAKPLGVGGCGAVFQAYQERLDRDVAVKVLLPSAASKIQGLAARFLREINLVKRLEHPNIVRLYDFGETENGLLWMAMELVRGPELATILAEEQQLPLERARHVVLQTLSGLAEAHALSIVHRDLKPGNIMITSKGADRDVVKLLDFGIGKALGDHEDATIQNLTGSHGDSFGTPRYMAPELLMKEEIGPHSDVYSTGLILYEAIVGLPAVIGETIYEILARQLSTPVELPDWLAGTQLGNIILKATAKDFRERYPSAFEFHTALREASLAIFEPPSEPAPPSQPSFDPRQLTQAQLALLSPVDPSIPAPPAVPLMPLPPNLMMPGGARFFAPGLSGVTPSGPLPSLSPPSGPPRDDAPSPEELKALTTSRSARQTQKVIIAVVAGFFVVTLVLWFALSSGGDEDTRATADKDKPTPADQTDVVDAAQHTGAALVPWSFHSRPGGATVQVDGRRVCDATPCVADIVQRDRVATVYFTLPGHLAMSKSIVPREAGTLDVELKALPRIEPTDVVDAPPLPN